MGEGGKLNLANVTSSDLVRSYQHSYQMNSWGLPDKIAALDWKQSYVEWEQSHVVGDDGAEARYAIGSNDLFEIQARWQHLQVQCKASDPNCVIGTISNHSFYDGFPNWYPLKQGAVYEFGWNHDGDMSVALVDLSLLFDGTTRDQYIQAVANKRLTDEQKQTLQALTRLVSNPTSNKFSYDLLGMVYADVDPSQVSAVQFGDVEDVTLPEGVDEAHQVSQQKQTIDTFIWGFKETLAVGYKQSTTVDLPGHVLEVGTEWSVNFQFEANQTTSTTRQATYVVQDTVQLHGPGKFAIRAYTDFVTDLPIPFAARFYISAKAGDYQLPASVVRALLQSTKFANGFTGTIAPQDVDATRVAVTIAGTLKGSFGVKGHVEVTKSDLNGQNQTRNAVEVRPTRALMPQR